MFMGRSSSHGLVDRWCALALFVCCLVVASPGCGGQQDVPECIQRIIDGEQDGYFVIAPVFVAAYQYREQLVFYFSNDCCDISNPVLDENCDYICSPDGGRSGGGDGQCLDFFGEATLLDYIWCKNRTICDRLYD